ncbi:unnamed protein product [Linum trigynum]|uniref:Uncharacterized protein n=1 Tax=Linum trigynum TaxID=586398 RepID=A0AAV2E3K5_9ROSI
MESKVKKETASSSSTSSKTMKLKLVIDKKKKKVILAEAQKDLVDFLIYFLSLPLSAVVKYLAGADEEVPGSIGKLHGSIASMTKQGYMKAPYNVCSRVLVPQLYTIASILPKLREDVTHASEADYVMEKVQYMVADDLSVSPLDFNSVLGALKRCDPGDVVEKEVEFGTSEALALLNASLHSKEALTAVFLKTAPPKVNV